MRLDKIGLEHNLPDCEHRQTKNGPKNRWIAAKIKLGGKIRQTKNGPKKQMDGSSVSGAGWDSRQRQTLLILPDTVQIQLGGNSMGTGEPAWVRPSSSRRFSLQGLTLL